MMEASEEQMNLDFEGKEEKQERKEAIIIPKERLHERDECDACGNTFDAPEGCAQCARKKRHAS